ncbi:hypothetical protein CRM22_001472 [Opisthorchis felineus]|uniref:Transmembrane protein n=1 Tax=Opisthorchis felineus TaxID=147828 RepID=A0A4S2MGY8_OPIFE|nr:hypothetical protein CRM22_001472 [Opisthorchis felineus]TGZ73508.1 hypothetical protein CRM22_001472 [Opisthorchis felineus]TGZ73510.1 hypothetical protein CRM22_001472 [Opisthorchis felineus]
MVHVPYVNDLLNAFAAPVKYLLSSTRVTAEEPTLVIVRDSSSLSMLVRLAGFSGALSVIAGAFGAHGFSADREKDKRIFQTGAYYNLVHSIALLGATQARRPNLTAGLFLLGMSMFCGSCYYVALTGDNRVSKIAPVGGITLIVAWLSFVV